MNTPAPTLDLSGLSPEAAYYIRELADQLRGAADPHPKVDPMGPSAEEWAARLRAFCDAQPWQHVLADDSRDSIYD